MGTGVRKRVEGAGLRELSREDRIAALRARMDTLENPGRETPQESVEVVDVGDGLGGVLPGGGLARRHHSRMSECAALAVELIAHCSGRGGHVAVVGWPELSYAGVVESGGDLDRIIAVPEPGPEPLNVSAVLVEGLDLVIHRFAVRVELTSTAARPLLAKLRAGTAALVLVGAEVASPAADIDAAVSTYRGLGSGTGRINGVDIDVRVRAKGRQPTRTRLTLGEKPRLRAV